MIDIVSIIPLTILALVGVAAFFLRPYAERMFADWRNSPSRMEKAVQQRRLQASERDLYSKAGEVTRILGTQPGAHDSPLTWGNNYKDSTLEICEIGDGMLVITCRGTVVFEAAFPPDAPNTITAYIPGEWEDHLSRLDARAKDVISKANAARRAEDQQKAKKNFGL
ncbi:MAG: hypothetical protein NTX27_19110 [Verrucomicrobia bacterium]|nr:hypothetical protein [Verrucomicrobiota bacterium]